MADSVNILVAFYSFEGNCRALGGAIADSLGADVMEVLPQREISRNFLGKYFAGGKASFFKETVPLAPPTADVASYDLVFVGTPVWAWNLPPATRSFLAATDWNGKKTAHFAMHRGGAGGALNAMRDLVAQRGGVVLGGADFVDLRRGDAGKTKAKAVAWAIGMADSARASPETGP